MKVSGIRKNESFGVIIFDEDFPRSDCLEKVFKNPLSSKGDQQTFENENNV